MPGEFLVAKLAAGPPLGASRLQMLVHDDSGDLRPAFARARDGVVFARVQVRL